MVSGAAILAMVLGLPPHRAQASTSTPNGRSSRSTHFIATGRAAKGSTGSPVGADAVGNATRWRHRRPHVAVRRENAMEPRQAHLDLPGLDSHRLASGQRWRVAPLFTRLSTGPVRATCGSITVQRLQFGVPTMCRMLKVTSSGDYDWLKGSISMGARRTPG